jgi:hypothetical protein
MTAALPHTTNSRGVAQPPSLPATDTALSDGGGARVGVKVVTAVGFGSEDTPSNKKYIKKYGHFFGPVFNFGHWCCMPQDDEEGSKGGSTPPSTTHASASFTMEVTAERPVVQKVVPKRHLYEFAADGCATTDYLRSDASFYPKGPIGGNNWVTITPPSPALPWDDAPGITNKAEGTSKPAGHYGMCKKDSSSDATGVEVWQ